jgi:phosphate transport system substrate-binding protein
MIVYIRRLLKRHYPLIFTLFIIPALSSSFYGCSADNVADKAAAPEQTQTAAPMNTAAPASLSPSPLPTVQSSPMPSDTPRFTKKDFERVDGSTATIPLSEAAAAKLLSIKPEEASKAVMHYTTHNAYMRLIDKTVDIILVTEPSAEELELAKKNNMELEIVPVVKDAFVFLVNKKNQVESLTLKQIQDIYSGKLTDWSQTGGSKGIILAYQRPLNSGSQTLMLNKVMKGIQMVTPEKNMEPAGMGDLIEVIAGYDNSEYALGYSVYYYANTMYIRDTVKLIGVNGVKPEPVTIKSDKYPLTSAYYAVFRKAEPADSFARTYLKWLLSEEGQRTAEEIGYIALK